MAARGAAVIAICGAGVSCGEDSRGGYPPSDLVSVLGSPAMPAGSSALEPFALVKLFLPFSGPFRQARDPPAFTWIRQDDVGSMRASTEGIPLATIMQLSISYYNY